MRTILAILVMIGILAATSFGQVVQLYNPNELGLSRTTFSFDEFADYTPANGLYQNVGVSFSRDDGALVQIIDWSRYGRQNPSGNNILATPAYPEIGQTQGFSTHLTFQSLQPLTEVGAFFGNDAYIGDFGFERLSIFGIAGQFLGSIDVAVNNNADVDQFIGLRSSVPFYSVRFENFTPGGDASASRAIAIDDLTFSSVPEPSTYVLFGTGLVCGWLILGRRIRSRPLPKP